MHCVGSVLARGLGCQPNDAGEEISSMDLLERRGACYNLRFEIFRGLPHRIAGQNDRLVRVSDLLDESIDHRITSAPKATRLSSSAAVSRLFCRSRSPAAMLEATRLLLTPTMTAPTPTAIVPMALSVGSPMSLIHS